MKSYKKRILLFVSKFPFIGTYARFLMSGILPNNFFQYLKFRLGLAQTYWPRDKTCLVGHPRRIFVGKNSKVGRPGTYIQGLGNVYIGDYVRFGPNVGILSSNHDLYNRDKSIGRTIRIGNYSWIGMNSLILAGVELGPSTIVGGGSVVTKSFPDGYVVIAGNPAKIIKNLNPEEVKRNYPHYENEYYGFVPAKEFEKNRKNYIDI